MRGEGGVSHWDQTYAQGDATRSWFQEFPVASIRMIDAAGAAGVDGVVDVGGGASCLVDALLERGLTDVTVMDLSEVGMAAARRRLGVRADRVQWVAADVRTWRPLRTFRVWHDRAVLHFMTRHDRAAYLETLRVATDADALAVFGCFAPDGPERCSGLPVTRYDVDDLDAILGPEWTIVAEDRERHRTPFGAEQPFIWAVFRRSVGAGTGIVGGDS